MEERIVLSAASFGLEDIVVMTGDAAPDEQGDARGTFVSFGDGRPDAPILNESGAVHFRGGALFEGDIEWGLFKGSIDDAVEQIARDGQTVPQIGAEFTNLGAFEPIHAAFPFNNNSETLFVGQLAGVAGDRDTGLFLGGGDSQNPAVLVREGDAAPDGDGVFGNFDEANAPVLNQAGQGAFRENLLDSSRADGIFRADASGNVVSIVRVFDQAPFFPGTFRNFSLPSINDHGEVAFTADVRANDASGQLAGVFLGDGAAPIQAIVLEGDPAPGGGTFEDFSFDQGVPVNNRGEVAFTASLESTQGIGVYVGDGAQLTEIVRHGDSLGEGDVFSVAERNVVLNENSQVAFVGEILAQAGINDLALFRGDGAGPPLQIAREGRLVPDGDVEFIDFSEFAMNDAGQVAFVATLGFREGGGASIRGEGLYFYDNDAGLIEVARRGSGQFGDEFNGFNIGDFFFAGNSRTQFLPNIRDGLNNDGLLAFEFLAADDWITVVDPLALNSGPDPLQVTGAVWLDADVNGLFGASESGIANVLVRLRAASDAALLDETVTGGDGEFVLQAPAPGEVFVEFAAPEGHVYTLQNAGEGADEDRDSDAAPGAGVSVTDEFTLSESSPAEPQGAGLVPLSTSAPSQNPVVAEDVDNNGLTTINDALLVVNDLREHGLGGVVGEPESMHDFTDVSGDNLRGISDLLAVIAALRNSTIGGFGSSGEGEQTSPLITDGKRDEAADLLHPLWAKVNDRDRALDELFGELTWK